MTSAACSRAESFVALETTDSVLKPIHVLVLPIMMHKNFFCLFFIHFVFIKPHLCKQFLCN